MEKNLFRKMAGWVVLIGICCAISACSKKTDQSHDSTSGSDKPVVYAVNYPLAYFAERIGGDSLRQYHDRNSSGSRTRRRLKNTRRRI